MDLSELTPLYNCITMLRENETNPFTTDKFFLVNCSSGLSFIRDLLDAMIKLASFCNGNNYNLDIQGVTPL